ncbi:MAG: hypothetical protein CMJ55_01705, partial [Planctomycetaceae bacterium]|nr:hypothetical protein [Planctomycetaceae bacterium]
MLKALFQFNRSVNKLEENRSLFPRITDQAMKHICILLLLLAFPLSLTAKEPVKLIFDTDMGNDIDDAMALAMIHS